MFCEGVEYIYCIYVGRSRGKKEKMNTHSRLSNKQMHIKGQKKKRGKIIKE